MSRENKITIKNYNNGGAEAYRDRRLADAEIPARREYEENKREILKRVLSEIPKDGKVFEIGSGLGEHAEFIKSLGYDMVASDASDGFLQIMGEKGLDPIKFNLVEDEFSAKYDLIYANAVLHHLTLNETVSAIQKVYNALKDEGIFLFTVSEGEGEKWVDEDLGIPRFKSYWTQEGIQEAVNEVGFSDVVVGSYDGLRTTRIIVEAKK